MPDMRDAARPAPRLGGTASARGYTLSKLLLNAVLGSSITLAGCSTVALDQNFNRVQAAVADRISEEPTWPTSSEARGKIDARVAELLTKPLDHERAVAIALINNRGLRAEYARIGFAEADLVEAGALDNPSLSMGIGFPDSPPSTTELDFGLTLGILQWILTPARRSIAQVQYDAEILSVADAVLRTATETRLVFLELQAAENWSAILREIAIAAEASYEFASRVHEAGNLSELALANELALYEQARLEYARSVADVSDHRERLNTQLGLWGTQVHWSIDERLPEIPTSEPEVGELEALAIRQRLDLAVAAKEVEVVSKALGLQSDWRYLLRTEVGANAARDADGQWVFGPSLSVELPIFNQRQGQVARLESARLAAEARLEGLAIEVRSEVRRLRDRLFATRYEAEQYRAVVLPLRERIVSLTQEQYNFMLVDTFDLLASKRESIAAYREYLESVKRYWETRILLEEAVGGRLPASPDRMPVEPDMPPGSDLRHEHSGDSVSDTPQHHGGH